ncbi:MAG: HAD hydrolase-like protein [Verrucomicrobia bacterium]|nr:HAD hydrolase-like protein [Verrucomicrobiota bacterium]
MEVKSGTIRSGRYKHIIWDWNGTLLDDAFLCVEVLNRMLGERNLPQIDHDAYRQNFDFPVVQYYRHVGFDFAREPFECISTQFVTGFITDFKRCKLQPMVKEILDHWKRSGLGLSILSASEQQNLFKQVYHYQLEHYFMALNGIDTIHAPGKTARGLQWIEALGLPKNEVLLIGDTLHDHEVADAIGTDCILLAHGHQTAERLARRGATVLADLERLKNSFAVEEGWLIWRGE